MVREHHRRNVRLAGVLLVLLAGREALAQPVMTEPLTHVPSDAVRGKAVAVNSDMGNCLICHRMPIAEVPEGAAGDIGPDLAGVGSRLSVPELRQRVVDPKAINPETVMPAYYVANGLYRVQHTYEGKAVLTAQQVEDLVAYLETLK